jgi:hypothetical protein
MRQGFRLKPNSQKTFIIDFSEHVLSFCTQNYLHHLKELHLLAWTGNLPWEPLPKDHETTATFEPLWCDHSPPTPALCAPLVLMANVWPQEFVHCEIVTCSLRSLTNKRKWFDDQFGFGGRTCTIRTATRRFHCVKSSVSSNHYICCCSSFGFHVP